ncbi:MAG: uncharacterized protein JWR62_3072 [Modestobacter sp.]|jgi:hypothetical protein|nr:uncharacterized protein [Modestobacter sp.]
MSTDSTVPTPAGPAAATPGTTTSEPELITSQPGASAGQPGTDGDPAGPVPAEEGEPGWITRHTTLLTTVLVAVIVAALAITGLVYYRDARDDRNAATEAAFAESVAAQGATLETVECDGGTCSAVVAGQAYTVLVQEDEAGDQHFGVTAFVGD